MKVTIRQATEVLLLSTATTFALFAVYNFRGQSLPWFAWVITFALFAVFTFIWQRALKKNTASPTKNPTKSLIGFAAVSAVLLLVGLVLLMM